MNRFSPILWLLSGLLSPTTLPAQNPDAAGLVIRIGVENVAVEYDGRKVPLEDMADLERFVERRTDAINRGKTTVELDGAAPFSRLDAVVGILSRQKIRRFTIVTYLE
jgi:hypothetical protein